MTYDVLERVSKAELIAWIKRNVFLPPISDEQFLQEAKLQKLMDDNEKLFKESEFLLQKLIEVKDDNFKFMAVNIELDKLRAKINENSEKINKIIRANSIKSLDFFGRNNNIFK